MKVSRFTIALVIFVIFNFILFFIAETILWMDPSVHNILLAWFNNPPASLSYEVHALVLQKLFVNQGFYNLFFAIGGIAGLFQLNKNSKVGFALILLVCFAGFGAGLVLAITTNAYILAFLQAVPAAIAFVLIYPRFKKYI